ncbi:hypothetical protein TWF730_008258 [Orbilia blumenaviensis]|uniref:Nephrocystin 3-like N-terminal domain-containing protein n=1 Tax=Orbilia blumenaviensis TaxID=1796055 RepID=A0AAV9V2N4_9PEZI
MDNTILVPGSNEAERGYGKRGISKRTVQACYEEACQKFRSSILSKTKSDQESKQQNDLLDKFLRASAHDFGAYDHNEYDNLQRECRKLAKEGEQFRDGDKADRLLTALNTIKVVGDGVLSMAPESISIVWFGISSMLTVATVKLEIRLLICDTCESITSMIGDCLRWEILDRKVNGSGSQNFSSRSRVSIQTDIWESNWSRGSTVTGLLVAIFEFLWHAQPHRDPSRLTRFKSTIKEAFTKDLQQRVDDLLEAHEELVKLANQQFQEILLETQHETRARMQKIREDLNRSVTITSQMLESLQCNALYEELKIQRDKISESKSHKLHFESLNDRASVILEQRKGHVANWFFEDPLYHAWKNPGLEHDAPNLICLESPRGHGKSTAMLCLRKKLGECTLGDHRPIILYFFFKKGDQDIQNARTALQSVVYQLLTRDELRYDIKVLSKCVELLNPAFGKPPDEFEATVPKPVSYDLTDIQSLCDLIRQVGNLLPRVYLLVDALDECQDRLEKKLVSHLVSMVDVKDSRMRLILSVRNTVDIKPEMLLPRDPNRLSQNPSEPQALYVRASSIVITSEKNSLDLKAYLTHDISDLLSRRIDQHAYEEYYNQELARIVDIIHQKANGDFALARMIIANLQQPSKLSLEDKILQLPAAIGEIYMTALESLKTEEQELVVTALKWAVWGVSTLTVVEISDHYREIYKKVEERSWNARPPERVEGRPENALSQKVLKHPDMNDPREQPEVKEIIHHLETIGRDFFRVDRHTGLITVDISIREWIQEDSKSGSRAVTNRAKGFDKYRDEGGYTVFKFTLTPSFVRYGDNFMELFDQKEAQMAITLDILRTLNNPNFQEAYMPWNPEWIALMDTEIDSGKILTAGARCRYEVEYWHEHLKILGNWWSEKALDDPYWSDLLTQLSIFTKPENWYRWILQPRESLNSYLQEIKNGGHDYQYLASSTLRDLVNEGPIHIASTYGLNILIDNQLKLTEKEMCKSRPNWFEFENVDEKIKLPRLATLIKDFQESLKTDRVLDVDIPSRGEFLGSARHPIQLAMQYPDTVECLIRHGAGVENWPFAEDGNMLLWILGFSKILVPNFKNNLPKVLETARTLIRNGATLNADIRDDRGDTLLHYAAELHDLEFFKLICFSVDWNGLPVDRRGMTPLHFLFLDRPEASPKKIQEVLDICQILVQLGTRSISADGEFKTIRDIVNAQDSRSRSPLMNTVESTFAEGAKKLIELGVDVHDDDNSGNTCFHLLADYTKSPRASPRDLDSTFATADLLFQQGLDITRTNNLGETAFMVAFQYGTMAMIQWLLEKFSKMEANHGEEHPFIASQPRRVGNILHFLSNNGPHFEVLPMIQEYIPKSVIHAAMNGVNRFRQTPLMLAAKYRYKSSFLYLRWLLSYGVEPELAGMRDQCGRTALDYFFYNPGRDIYRGHGGKSTTSDGVDMCSDTFWKLFAVTPSEKRWSIFSRTISRRHFWAYLDYLDPEGRLKREPDDEEPILDEHGWTKGEIIDSIPERKESTKDDNSDTSIAVTSATDVDPAPQEPPEDDNSDSSAIIVGEDSSIAEHWDSSDEFAPFTIIDPTIIDPSSPKIKPVSHPNQSQFHRAPSRLTMIFDPEKQNSEEKAKLSNNGLHLSLDLNSNEGFPGVWVVAVADHPVPAARDFYFEAGFSFSAALQPVRSGEGDRVRIYLAQIHDYHAPRFSVSVLPDSIEAIYANRASDWGWGARYDHSKIDAEQDIDEIDPMHILDTSTESSNKPTTDKATSNSDGSAKSEDTVVTVGIGVNTKTRLICITYNGKKLPDYYALEYQRYFPMISLASPCHECVVNFGSSPFLFEPANSIDWKVSSDDEAVGLAENILDGSHPLHDWVGMRSTELFDICENPAVDPDYERSAEFQD